jgi:hypothetical protein
MNVGFSLYPAQHPLTIITAPSIYNDGTIQIVELQSQFGK